MVIKMLNILIISHIFANFSVLLPISPLFSQFFIKFFWGLGLAQNILWGQRPQFPPWICPWLYANVPYWKIGCAVWKIGSTVSRIESDPNWIARTTELPIIKMNTEPGTAVISSFDKSSLLLCKKPNCAQNNPYKTGNSISLRHSITNNIKTDTLKK